MGVGDGLGPPLASPPGESPGVGVALWAVPPPVSGACSREGVREGTGVSSEPAGTSDVEEDELRPVTASLTVVPLPPPKALPDTSSYVVMPAMVTPNTTAAATTGRRRLLTRAR
ncbi:hypothetical protein [Streptomyces barringtoniae]|uniref:hypothetical protein n=1 Tax=Streptomyces barringtoniae TaxID=2892029 RepID=UPI0027E2C4E7|nr:hypothetical protein [Streptomyces barringtoniae]